MKTRLLLAVFCSWCLMAFVCSSPAPPPPPPPTQLHSVTFPWTHPDVSVFFNVYCGAVPGGEGIVPINSVPISGRSFVFANAPSGIYYCKVQAVSGTRKSPMSNEKGVTVP